MLRPLKKFREITKARDITLATQGDLVNLFPEYNVGAEPPFGHLYGLEVYAEKALDRNQTAIFNAGTHTDTVRMKFSDYLRIVKPKVVELGTHI